MSGCCTRTSYQHPTLIIQDSSSLSINIELHICFVRLIVAFTIYDMLTVMIIIIFKCMLYACDASYYVLIASSYLSCRGARCRVPVNCTVQNTNYTSSLSNERIVSLLRRFCHLPYFLSIVSNVSIASQLQVLAV